MKIKKKIIQEQLNNSNTTSYLESEEIVVLICVYKKKGRNVKISNLIKILIFVLFYRLRKNKNEMSIRKIKN